MNAANHPPGRTRYAQTWAVLSRTRSSSCRFEVVSDWLSNTSQDDEKSFRGPGPNLGDQMSALAETFILGAGHVPADFPGDGLIPGPNQQFTNLLPDFGGVKGQQEKVIIAALLRERTAVGNPWISHRLAMGHPGSVNRLVVTCGRSPSQTRELAKLKKMLKCDT